MQGAEHREGIQPCSQQEEPAVSLSLSVMGAGKALPSFSPRLNLSKELQPQGRAFTWKGSTLCKKRILALPGKGPPLREQIPWAVGAEHPNLNEENPD